MYDQSYILYWGTIYYIGGIHLVFVAGMLWGIMSAGLTERLAKRGGFDVQACDYGTVGLRYSMALMVPYLLLVANLIRRPVTGIWLRLVYVPVYASWVIGPFFFAGIILESSGEWFKAYFVILFIAMLFMVGKSLLNFLIWPEELKPKSDSNDLGLLERKHLMPFVYLLVSSFLAMPIASLFTFGILLEQVADLF